MDYEQKYKEALERAKRMFSEKELNYLFPELKESEDERIRKEIIEYIKTGTYHKNWVVWLEKQGEQTQLDYEHADIPQKDFAPIENKMLNADKVIEWIDEHVPTKFEDMANYVEDFKQYFEL